MYRYLQKAKCFTRRVSVAPRSRKFLLTNFFAKSRPYLKISINKYHYIKVSRLWCSLLLYSKYWIGLWIQIRLELHSFSFLDLDQDQGKSKRSTWEHQLVKKAGSGSASAKNECGSTALILIMCCLNFLEPITLLPSLCFRGSVSTDQSPRRSVGRDAVSEQVWGRVGPHPVSRLVGWPPGSRTLAQLQPGTSVR